MNAPTPIRIREQQCWLSPERCLYWEEGQTLVVSDLHFGKTGHFRKSGIPVPQEVYREDLQRLMQQVQHFQPRRLILTGDLFHSDENLEHAWFARWRASIPAGEIHLVRGNHDRLPATAYHDLDLILHDEAYHIGPFTFIHDASDLDPDQPAGYLFSGHLHPGIRISGAGKQSLRFPCFYFSEDACILPAFSKFTGLKLLSPAAGDKVFAVIPGNSMRGEMAGILQIQ